MKKILILVSLAIAVLVMARSGCSQDLTWSAVLKGVRTEFKDVRHISTDSLAERLRADAVVRPVLLDARTAEEYAVSHLEGAIRIDPDNPEISALHLPTDAPIVAYCSVGYRSSSVARALQEQGYTNVVNLEGSLFKWANEGRPLVTNSATGQSGEAVGIGETPPSAEAATVTTEVTTEIVHPYNTLWGKLLDRRIPRSQ